MEAKRSVAISLRMAEPSEIAGSWVVEAGGRRCSVELSPERIESANAHRLLGGGDCLATMMPATPVGWRPAPDGIELVGADRLTLAMFADAGDGSGVATLAGGRTARLRRAR